MIFTFEQITNLNSTELIVYNCIIKNIDKVKKMNIRELADACHVSTATINRFCHKLDCNGYSEFKIQLRVFTAKNKIPEVDNELNVLLQFFDYSKQEDFKENIRKAVELITQSDFIVFLGIGQSGSMAKYAARFFSNIGYFSQYIDDPFYPAPTNKFDNRLLIALSNRGETKEVIDQLRLYQSAQSKILSITSDAKSTLAKMSDVCIPYYLENTVLPTSHNITSQVPVVYIIERIARELQHVKNQDIR